MKKREKKQILLTKKIKPLRGKNRSFSNRATGRWFYNNVQKFKIDNQIVWMTARDYRSFSKY